MPNVRITVLKKTFHQELSSHYENPISHACDLKEGQEFLSIDGKIPPGFCQEAWKSVGPFALRLANGEEDFFDGWMKNPKTAVISCNDGIRPVSFLLEAVD